tara:strand:+ start:4233 stop:5693 length:1461 start_codon:yes stop_codon:yes gene_type:complete
MQIINKLNFKYLKKNFLVFFAIPLFPLFLITGPFIPDMFSVILGMVFLYTLYVEKNWNELYENNYFIYFILIFLYLNLNSFLSFNQEISFLKSLPFIRIVLFIFALSFFLNRYNNLYKNFFYCFLTLLLLMFLDSLIQLLFNLNIFGAEITFDNRMSSFFGDEKIMGSYITRLLPIIISVPFIVNFKKKFLINFIILIFSSILVFLSAERLAIFYLLSFVIFYFFITKKFFLKFISLIFVCIFFINLYNPIFSERIINSTIKQFNNAESITSYRHLLHYKTAYEMFKDNKIFGHGLKSFRNLCSEDKYVTKIQKKIRENENFYYFAEADGYFYKENKNLFKIQYINLSEPISKKFHPNFNYFLILKNNGEKFYKGDKLFLEYEHKNGCNTHPHNIYLEFLSELGIIGFLLFSVIMFYCLIKILFFLKGYLLDNKINDLLISKNLILFGIFIQMFPLTPSGSFFNNYMLLIFHISIGFYLSVLKIKE